MRSVQLQPSQAPPPDYYQANLLTVCQYVARVYPGAMTSQDHLWVAALEAAGTDAQRLYARLLMRKGPLFRQDKLAYKEIFSMQGAIDALVDAGLARTNAEVPAQQLLMLLTKPELQALTKLKGRKEAMLTDVLSRLTDRQIRARIGERFTWLHLLGLDRLRRVQLLYFGRAQQDLSAFVLRDLGLVRYEEYEVQTELAPFANVEAVNEYLRLRALSSVLHAEVETDRFAPWVLTTGQQDAERWRNHRTIQRARDRLFNNLGRWAERNAHFDLALNAYAQSSRHPARERRVRLLSKMGAEEEARAILDSIASAPLSAEETVFAERFGKRNAGFAPQTTVVPLPDPNMEMRPGAIESCALQLLQQEGAWGVHTENACVLSLTGLAYWEALFAPVAGAFSNPMQSAPNDLLWEDFAASRSTLIQALTQRVREDPGSILRTWQEKRGRANALVAWDALTLQVLQRIVTAMGGDHLARLVGHTIRNLSNARTGFPDLFVVHTSGEYELIEVKGPNDALQPQQRAWFRTLHQLGIPARVLKLKA